MAVNRFTPESVILVGDIGGTNVNLALVGRQGRDFHILLERHYKTREERSLMEPLARILADAGKELPGIRPERCCVSGAGPVIDGRIELTNAPWGIDGPAIEEGFRIPTLVINDFMAVSYGVVLLDPRNPAEITRLPHLDGSDPLPAGDVAVVLGAGTGLGAGYLVRGGDRFLAFPSEGGHITLPAYDERSRRLQAWLTERYGFVPGAEAAVSGMGIAAIHEFLSEQGDSPNGLPENLAAINGAPPAERPALIARAAGGPRPDPLARAAMELFVTLYARVAADLAATFIPAAGLYLAGGIASKNETLFLEDRRFMRSFERSYREHIRAILGRIPVMIVKDYSISLYGAANAAFSIQRGA